MSAPSFPDRDVWWQVLQVHGQGGHGQHEDPPDGAAHQHAQHDRGIIKLIKTSTSLVLIQLILFLSVTFSLKKYPRFVFILV